MHKPVSNLSNRDDTLQTSTHVSSPARSKWEQCTENIAIERMKVNHERRGRCRTFGRGIRLSSLIFFPDLFIIKKKCRGRMADTDDEMIVVTNRKARHDYTILDTFEAGIVLKGTEVKSLRQGKGNLQDSYAVVRRGEVWLVGMHIGLYDHGNINNHEPRRDRKLLLHKREIRRLFGKVAEKGKTMVPLRVYFKSGIAKVEVAIAQGKRSFDKRETIKKREIERELERRFRR